MIYGNCDMKLPDKLYKNNISDEGTLLAWDTKAMHETLTEDGSKQSLRTTERALEASGLIPGSVTLDELRDENGNALKQKVQSFLEQEAGRKRLTSVVVQQHTNQHGQHLLFGNDQRGGRRWVYVQNAKDMEEIRQALTALAGGRHVLIWPHGSVTATLRDLQKHLDATEFQTESGNKIRLALSAYQEPTPQFAWDSATNEPVYRNHLSNLDRLEADSIYILREVVAQAKNPAMLFSLGKDSCVMLHLAKKAFYPSPPPFPLIHVDTRWKFRAMYQFRDEIVRTSGMDMIIHVNPEAISKDINPFDHGSELHTRITKTEGLKQVLDHYKIDIALGGARRDEEKSRSKERVFSIRNASHRWDPKRQRPELWNLYNGYKDKNESIRVFPLSDWTELDIWQYIYREQIPIIPLYFADYRPVVERDGIMMMVDDDRIELYDNEEIKIKKVRFRTLGCYPLTGALESNADDLPSIVLELLHSISSERQGRIIDQDSNASMEKKKQEGYF